MNPKEIRIGNFISHNGHQFKEWQFMGGDIQYADIMEIAGELIVSIKNAPIEEIKPIEITGEWLTKFGFVGNPAPHYIFHKDKIELALKDNGREYWITLGRFTIQLNYVHQLQNLYFSLTNKELELI